MSLVHANKAGHVSEPKTVAFGRDSSVPIPIDWPTWKPATDSKTDAPETHSDEKRDTDPSHNAGLEDTKVLQEQGNLDDCGIGDVH